MNSYIHEFCAAVALYTLIVGLLTVAARSVLSRRVQRAPVRFGGSHTALLLVAPTLIAGIWVTSSLLHKLEPGQSLADCCAALAMHIGIGELFWLGFAAVISYGGFAVVKQLMREAPVALSSCRRAACRDRVRVLCSRDPELQHLETVIRITASGPAAVARGLLRPRVELNHALLGQIRDEELRAVLHHEAEHLRARDPWRLTLVALALGLNPFGRLLRRPLAQWQFGRELQCDLRAVQRGADPISLAAAIVAAARSTGPLEMGCAGIAHPSTAQVSARVHLLMTYADQPPSESLGAPLSRTALATGAALLIAVPHILGSAFAFHCILERGLRAFVG